MESKVKACVALVLLVIGMFLLIEGSRITLSGRPVWIDLVLIVAGGAMAVAYLPLIGHYLELRLKAPRNVSFVPMLIVLGAALVYQGALRPLSVIEKVLFIGLGIMLVVVSPFVIYKLKKH